MPFIKYTEHQLLAAQELCADFCEGEFTLAQCVQYLRAIGIHNHRITMELHNAILTHVFDTSEQVRKSSARYRKIA